MSNLRDAIKRIDELEKRVDNLESHCEVPPSATPHPVEPPATPVPTPGKPKGWKEGDRMIHFGPGKNGHNIQYDFEDGDWANNIDDTCAAGTTNWYYFDIPKASELVKGNAIGFKNSVVDHPVRNSGMFTGSVAFQQGDREIGYSCCGYEIGTFANTEKNDIDFGKPFYWKVSQRANPSNVIGGFRLSWGIYTYWTRR